MAHVFIGLGSNLGDRQVNLAEACRLLLSIKGISLLKKSSIEETKPVDFLEQPDFLNQIIQIKTLIDPLELLNITKKIENGLGRVKTIPKGPRIIDLDILLYDDLIMNSPELTIPHPQIKNRKFILKHLIEIDPELADPVTGILYRKYYTNS